MAAPSLLRVPAAWRAEAFFSAAFPCGGLFKLLSVCVDACLVAMKFLTVKELLKLNAIVLFTTQRN